MGIFLGFIPTTELRNTDVSAAIGDLTIMHITPILPLVSMPREGVLEYMNPSSPALSFP